jgi:Protein of unknown function (DUF2281)
MAVLEITEEQIIKVLEQLLPEQRERILHHFSATQSPLEEIATKRKFGRGKDKILYMADDFDAPLEDFAEYM